MAGLISDPTHKVRRLVAEVGRRCQPIAGELTLVSRVPLRQVCGFRFPGHLDVDPGKREQVGRGERAPARIVRVRVVEWTDSGRGGSG